MKEYKVELYRHNPQLAGGGYITTRTIEARTIASARKQAREMAERCLYGSMKVLSVREKGVRS